MAECVSLTAEPVRITTTGSNVKQDLRLALDVSTYDELDLLLTVYENGSGADLSVTVLTGMAEDSESGWVSAGTFPGTGSGGPAANKLNIKNFLRYIRYQLNASSSFTASFAIEGMGRRYSPTEVTPQPRQRPPLPKFVAALEMVDDGVRPPAPITPKLSTDSGLVTATPASPPTHRPVRDDRGDRG
jgi:hypothetical protein